MATGITKKEATLKFATTDGVARKIYEGVRKGSVKFGEVKETADEFSTKKAWKGVALPNGAIVSFGMEQKHGQNKNKKNFNPRYRIYLEHEKNKQEFSGLYARKIYIKLTTTPNKRSNKLTEESSSFVESALIDL